MRTLVDKAIIFTVSLILSLVIFLDFYVVVPILLAVSLSAVLSYFEEERITGIAWLLFIGGCFYLPALQFFLPLLCYDLFFHRYRGLWLLALLPPLLSFLNTGDAFSWMIGGLVLFSGLLRHRTRSLQVLESQYHRLRDNTKEISLRLEQRNKELLEKQDYEINLATVTERNRIARDIHDNVGHLLSRSLLQVGALLAIYKEEGIRGDLRQIQASLSEAMDGIRANVHQLYEASIHPETEIRRLLEEFTFCPVRFEYDVNSQLEQNLKYCFIAVTKEALSNMMRHSNATEAYILLHEHPAFYQLVIQDNGSGGSYQSENGIGIRNIIDRVEAIGGRVHISAEKGFRIFITIQKKSGKER